MIKDDDRKSIAINPNYSFVPDPGVEIVSVCESPTCEQGEPQTKGLEIIVKPNTPFGIELQFYPGGCGRWSARL